MKVLLLPPSSDARLAASLDPAKYWTLAADLWLRDWLDTVHSSERVLSILTTLFEALYIADLYTAKAILLSQLEQLSRQLHALTIFTMAATQQQLQALSDEYQNLQTGKLHALPAL